MEQINFHSDILVVGAGISGISTALEAAETGFTVTLLEKRPYAGGRVAQLNQYFPKLCPPTCGLEINFRRMKDNPNITLYTLAEILGVTGSPGNYNVKVKLTPTYVREEATETECVKTAEEITVERENEFNYGLDKTKALYLPYNNCYPMRYVFDKSVCTKEELADIKETFGNVIDLDQKEEIIELKVKSIVWATGWDPYNAGNLDNLAYKDSPAVVTNVEMERLAAPSGPTAGKIVIPGSETTPRSVAFVQCAGSRDENHLEYCSTICCLASMKQARYIREQYPETEIHIFYIDLRAYGIFEDFYNDTKKDEKLFFHRGKVAKVLTQHDSSKLIVEAEDTLAGELNQVEVDMVVLATGMKPTTSELSYVDPAIKDRNGFVDSETGQIGCGVCTRPKDVAGVVQESTAAAMKAIHTVKGGM